MSIPSKILIFLVKIYQKTIGNLIYFLKGSATCRFLPTCSEYCILAVKKHGFLKGLAMSFKRVSKCHPWSKQSVDFP